jgi:hypothetical protein
VIFLYFRIKCLLHYAHLKFVPLLLCYFREDHGRELHENRVKVTLKKALGASDNYLRFFLMKWPLFAVFTSFSYFFPLFSKKEAKKGVF